MPHVWTKQNETRKYTKMFQLCQTVGTMWQAVPVSTHFLPGTDLTEKQLPSWRLSPRPVPSTIGTLLADRAKCITLGPKVLVSLCVSFYFPFHGLATEDREAPGNSRVEGTWWQSLQELPSCQENPVPTASWVRNKLVALAFSQGWCLCSGRCQPVQYR